MKTEDSSFKILFEKYLKNEASSEEIEQLFKIIGAGHSDAELSGLLDWELENTSEAEVYDPKWDDTLRKIRTRVVKVPANLPSYQVKRLWPRIFTVAAAVLLVVSIAVVLNNYTTGTKNYAHLIEHDIRPGKLGATLTLADGKKIRLSDAGNGVVAKEAGISVSKSADGQISYEIKGSADKGNHLHTLSTSRGETYVLTLPDQTRVWLNAGSSLTYNASNNQNERNVKLRGEAYFEVAKDKIHPFFVKSGDQQIKVLGTHFNVSAYEEEKAIRTTLLEGSVEVSENGMQRIIQPGEQATNSGAGIKVNKVDTELAVAWKSNNFIFDRLGIQEIMRSIARWYDVEVIYEGEIPKGTFWGSVSRFDNVSKVLIPLEATGNVHFRIEGRKIYVFH